MLVRNSAGKLCIWSVIVGSATLMVACYPTSPKAVVKSFISAAKEDDPKMESYVSPNLRGKFAKWNTKSAFEAAVVQNESMLPDGSHAVFVTDFVFVADFHRGGGMTRLKMNAIFRVSKEQDRWAISKINVGVGEDFAAEGIEYPPTETDTHHEGLPNGLPTTGPDTVNTTPSGDGDDVLAARREKVRTQPEKEIVQPTFKVGDAKWCRSQKRTNTDEGIGEIDVKQFLDFDGDGSLDCSLTNTGLCGSGGCLYFHYVMQGECGTFVGSSDEVTAWDAPRRPDGWIGGFTATHYSGCSGREECRFRLRDRRYREKQCRYCSRDDECLGTTWDCEPWKPATRLPTRLIK